MWLFGDTSTNGCSFETAAVTDCGLVRAENQDSFFVDAEHGVFCVADGMGGGEGGALASKWVCEGLSGAAETFAGMSGAARFSVVDDAIQHANKRIRAYADEKGFRMMGSTVALVSFDSAAGSMLIVHAGDSRVYRLRGKRIEQLTRDHTIGDELGRLTTGSEAESRNFRSRRNPLTHILTRAIGTELNARPESIESEFRRGDRYLLCTDGVHDMLSDDEIAAIMGGRGAPDALMKRFSSSIRAAGAADNFTIVYIRVV